MVHKQFTTVSDFKHELLQLNKAHGALRTFLLDRCVCQMARIFTLPVIEQPQANERHVALMRLRQESDAESLSVPLDEPFTVTEQSGFTAFTQSVAHFQKMYAGDGESTRYSKRLPGLLCLNTDEPDKLLKLVLDINAQKDVLASTIRNLADDVNMRFELVHNAEPGFMQTMATRHITAIANTQLLSVSFQWEHKNVIKRMTKDEVLERIEGSLEHGKYQRSTYETQEGFELFVEKERETILSYPDDATFKTIRPAPPVVLIRVRLNEENPNPDSPEKTRRRNFFSHSPVLVINGGVPERLTPLRDYPGRPKSSFKTPVIKRLHLYEG